MGIRNRRESTLDLEDCPGKRGRVATVDDDGVEPIMSEAGRKPFDGRGLRESETSDRASVVDQDRRQGLATAAPPAFGERSQLAGLEGAVTQADHEGRPRRWRSRTRGVGEVEEVTGRQVRVGHDGPQAVDGIDGGGSKLSVHDPRTAASGERVDGQTSDVCRHHVERGGIGLRAGLLQDESHGATGKLVRRRQDVEDRATVPGNLPGGKLFGHPKNPLLRLDAMPDQLVAARPAVG